MAKSKSANESASVWKARSHAAYQGYSHLSGMEIAIVLTEYDPMYEEIAYRFLEHFVWITYAMDRIGVNHDEMWDTADGFFYDLLHLPNGDAVGYEDPLNSGIAATRRRGHIGAGHV